MADKSKPTTRQLYAWEVQEGRRVFANQLNYDAVRVHESHWLPNRVGRIGARLKGLPIPPVQNAITLGNHIYFPVPMLTVHVAAGDPEYYKLPWLIHELTHAWQYQHLGWRYLLQALKDQFRGGIHVYNFGGEDGLLERLANGAKFTDFNLEQQGDIARTYYERLVHGQDTRAWNRFIAEVQGVDSPVSIA